VLFAGFGFAEDPVEDFRGSTQGNLIIVGDKQESQADDRPIEKLGLGEILKLLELEPFAKFLRLRSFAARARPPFARSSRVSSWASTPFLSRCPWPFDCAPARWSKVGSAVAGAV
jgi:hypothetical protein